ncbi:multidrug DMT transporter permease [Rhizobium sp. Leaf384]|nr:MULTISPECIES: DMT family transporter [unclassified Rhizobium]KQS76144.1 multidrug DMT transporter permease [Rhizobium sp. Leaf384]KQS85889.1 multidrug DMT transporter permease [Rhizobium sp. Leaf383]
MSSTVPLDPPVARPVGLGIVFMLLGMLLFSLNDTMGKWLVETYPVLQLMAIRSVAALLVLLPLVLSRGLSNVIRVERPGLQALRSLLFAIDATAFYFAVRFMPLADAMIYWLAVPIYVAALSPFLLGEKVGWRRWTAILIGFAGVLVALDPSRESLSLPALVAFFGSACFAIAIILGRTLRTTPDMTLVVWQFVGSLVFSLVGIAVVPGSWIPLDPETILLPALLGVVAMSAHVLVSRSLKLADAATVVPLQYTLLFWAVVFGWIFFGDVPRPSVIIGAALIVASGLFILFREQTIKKGHPRDEQRPD